MTELETSLIEIHPYSQELYEELLYDYIGELFTHGRDAVLNRLLELQFEHDEIEATLPNVDDASFERVIVLGDMIGAIYEVL